LWPLWLASVLIAGGQDAGVILEKHCVPCHHAGGIAPMRLDSYEAARPWAKAIREAVLTRKMPPWLADPAYGKFANDRSLTRLEIDTLAAWAVTAPPLAIHSAADSFEWSIGAPDVILRMPKPVFVPAHNPIAYQYIPLPTHFEHDTWVQGVEARPSDPSVVHHAVVYIREPGSTWT
jgi:hypothetical protein